eukprot:SAG22_NODE_623_length_8459_cov_39.989474_4_plen_144_part_00
MYAALFLVKKLSAEDLVLIPGAFVVTTALTVRMSRRERWDNSSHDNPLLRRSGRVPSTSRQIINPTSGWSTPIMSNHTTMSTATSECIDAIDSTFKPAEVQAFCRINAFKYLWRSTRHNDPTGANVRKAIWFLERSLIDQDDQ